MSTPEHPGKDPSLTDKIKELESLLEQQEPNQELDTYKEEDTIPVLDELVTAEDYVETAKIIVENTTESTDDIDGLARKLEEKFSTELDQLIHVLKGNLKNSIMEELRTELNRQTGPQEEYDQQGSNNNELPK